MTDVDAAPPSQAPHTRPATPFNPGTGTGHVIVCGLSNLGLRIAEQLHDARVPVVVVDDEGEAAAWRQLHRWGVPAVQGVQPVVRRAWRWRGSPRPRR